MADFPCFPVADVIGVIEQDVIIDTAFGELLILVRCSAGLDDFSFGVSGPNLNQIGLIFIAGDLVLVDI